MESREREGEQERDKKKSNGERGTPPNTPYTQ